MIISSKNSVFFLIIIIIKIIWDLKTTLVVIIIKPSRDSHNVIYIIVQYKLSLSIQRIARVFQSFRKWYFFEYYHNKLDLIFKKTYNKHNIF